ncbi:MAG: hypothetical protein F2667_13560 [Actinobacteria bacterium]|uniref:Unannotated protein n=1 Tax=freshwater metagenome TaxID=449393 RepID=A0A6J6S8X1_9ZZZZ|nr:hypothetical protein [Actinomycetota bacterium]
MNPVTGLSLGRIGLGIAALAKPDLVARQITGGTPASTSLLTQWFGTREVALGAATLLTSGSARRTLVLIGMAVDAADATTGYQAVQRKEVPQAAGLPAVAVAGGAVIAGLLGLRTAKKVVKVSRKVARQQAKAAA